MIFAYRPLLLAVVAIVASFVFALWLSQRRLNDVEQDIYEVAAIAEPSVVHLDDARAELDRLALETDAYVFGSMEHLAAAQEARVRVDDAHARLHEALAAYARLPFFPGEEALYRDAEKELGPVDDVVRTILARTEAADIEPATLALLGQLHPDVESLNAKLKVVIDYDTRRAVTELEAIAAKRRSSWRAAVVGGALSLVLSLAATIVATFALWKAADARRRADRERAAVVAAREEIRRRDRFLVLVSHELRTPLTALKLAIDALGRERALDSASLQSTAARQVKRMSVLVEDLILVAQVDLDSIVIERRPTDLLALVRERVERQGLDIGRSGSTVRARGDASVVGEWDPSVLGRIVDKLLSNAIRFGAGGPIDVTVSRHGPWARVVVHDRGIGIPADRLPTLFERFERGVAETSYPGLGLGLYLARALARRMDGDVRVASTPAEGTTFTVDLPISRAAPAEASRADAHATMVPSQT